VNVSEGTTLYHLLNSDCFNAKCKAEVQEFTAHANFAPTKLAKVLQIEELLKR